MTRPSGHISWSAEIGLGDRPHVGGKAGSLGELHRAGIGVPPGFVVRTSARPSSTFPRQPQAKDVAEITLLEESDFDELYLELDGMKLSLRRGGSANPAGEIASSALRPGTVAAAGAATVSPPDTHAPPAAAIGSADDPGQHTVTAPLLGAFYRAPKPGALPFVEVGSEVEPDTVIGILEVMKLINTVRAGARGRVAQIFARDGALVEYGEALLRVSRIN